MGTKTQYSYVLQKNLHIVCKKLYVTLFLKILFIHSNGNKKFYNAHCLWQSVLNHMISFCHLLLSALYLCQVRLYFLWQCWDF